jgi:hypothetical protein
MKKQYKALAMGSDEGYDLAEKTINAAAKTGSWVLLKNIHLAPQVFYLLFYFLRFQIVARSIRKETTQLGNA